MPLTRTGAMLAAVFQLAPLATSAQTAPVLTADAAAPDIVVRSRVDDLGRAKTASQGSVTQEELELRPVYRVGQLLETVPGLVVTTHSGEGKANQFFIRGFALDHGTDFATFIDDMPVNEVTHAHGQGYTDLHFFIPELAGGLDYTKGPFYGSVGDFGGLGSARIQLVDDIPNQVSGYVGTLGDQRLFVGGTAHLPNGDRLLAAGEVLHLDGPFDNPDNFRSLNAVSRYAHGSRNDGFDVTLMAHRSQSSFTTDQPSEARTLVLIGRFGSLDPSDGSFAERFSASGHYAVSGENWVWRTSAYGIHSRLQLWNDFTFYLVDRVNGDQELQSEVRDTVGGQSTYTRSDEIAGIPTETEIGIQGRHDDVFADRRATRRRVVLPACPNSPFGGGVYTCNADDVALGTVGGYVQHTTRWLPWLRTVVALREDYASGSDSSRVTGFQGSADKPLFQPKGSLIFGPWHETEVYLSAGEGFHSNDIRGVLGTVPALGQANPNQGTPLLTKIVSQEAGIRSSFFPRTSLTASIFQLDFDSFLTYDQDNGVNSAGPPARLRGVELSAQYRPYDWIELSADLNFTRSRYHTGDLESFGVPGPYLPNAPNFVGSFGAIIDNLGPWFGGAEFRWLGAQPLTEDNSIRSKGFRELNVSAGYKITDKIKVQLSIYNLFNSHANAVEYAHDYRLTPDAPDGFGRTYHPLEPISARVQLTAVF